jgi:hypothetical protein
VVVVDGGGGVAQTNSDVVCANSLGLVGDGVGAVAVVLDVSGQLRAIRLRDVDNEGVLLGRDGVAVGVGSVDGEGGRLGSVAALETGALSPALERVGVDSGGLDLDGVGALGNVAPFRVTETVWVPLSMGT